MATASGSIAESAVMNGIHIQGQSGIHWPTGGSSISLAHHNIFITGPLNVTVL